MEAMAAELKIEDISSVKKKLSFEVLWADVKNELDKSYKIVGRNASIKGFRKGKVPSKCSLRYITAARSKKRLFPVSLIDTIPKL